MLEAAGCCQVKLVTKRVLYQKSTFDCFICQNISVFACSLHENMVCLQTLAIYSQLKATRNGKHLLSQLKMCLLNCVCWGGKAQLLLCRRTSNIMVCFAIFYTFTVTYQVVCRSKGFTRTFLVEHHITPCNQLSQTSSNNLLTT